MLTGTLDWTSLFSFGLSVALIILILMDAEISRRTINQMQQLEHKLKEMEEELNSTKKEKDIYHDFDDAK